MMSWLDTLQIPSGMNVKLDGNICKVLLNNPKKLNPMSIYIYQALGDVLKNAGKDNSIKVVLLTGSGKYFTSGNDLSAVFQTFKEHGSKDPAQLNSPFKDMIDAMIDFPKLFVVGINGPAVGIGVTMLPLADFVYCSDNATFLTPFTKLALIPEACSSYTFAKIMGYTRAKDLLIGGKKLNSNEALQCGLVTEVIPKAQFDEVLEKKVRYLASLLPESVMMSKKLIVDEERDLLHRVNERENEKLAGRWLSKEGQAVVKQFLSRKSKL